jgi:hypothetical protein
MCKHIRVVLPNNPGEAATVLDQLARSSESSFNVLGYMLSDLGDTGILYLLVTHHAEAYLLLKDVYKNRVAEKEALVVSVPHKPGTLLPVLSALAKQQINVRTSYQAFSIKGEALLVIEPDSETELLRAKECMTEMGATILTEQP